jgi:hypothetical protein
VFGIAGLIVGATSYRAVGGALLVFDAVLLVIAAYLGLRNMRDEKLEEKDQKSVLERMMREGTLDQYLRDLRAASPDAVRADGEAESKPPPASAPPAPSRPAERASSTLRIPTPAT